MAFLRFHLEEPFPTKWQFPRRSTHAPAAMRAVKVMENGREVTLEIGPESTKRLMPYFDAEMRLTDEARALLQANEVVA
ncbi:hypothetical protein [Caulobacter sp. 17J65-9]|uniref:hypothetical protein n=1 Tax=Caulobacter sp. 17J65-9 TaxID=2709382 RepID=UPI0013CA8995|nr:hypothetical protein [Caulobacter sp. 17J65-9]NEX91211.1 hypothetical protein [Caulobacter sp. 17J65-9]